MSKDSFPQPTTLGITAAARRARGMVLLSAVTRRAIGHLAHLHACDTSFVLVSRAPLANLEVYKKRMGWTIPWYSSAGSDFNVDFGVTTARSVAPRPW